MKDDLPQPLPQPHNEPNEDADPASSDLQATAFHEAGHAVMGLVLGRPIQKVTISPAEMQTGGTRLGAVQFKKGRSKPTRDWLEDEVLILFAGMVAQSHVTNEYCSRGADQDLRAVKRLLTQTRATSERQLEKLERRLFDKTEHLLSQTGHAKAVELIASELIEKKTISGRAVRHLFDQAQQQRPI